MDALAKGSSSPTSWSKPDLSGSQSETATRDLSQMSETLKQMRSKQITSNQRKEL